MLSTGPSHLEPFLLADIGEGIAEVEVLQWYVEAGETISMFDKVCEVQSDKATVDISSKFDGVVATLHYEVGDMAEVGAPLITVQVEGEAEAQETADEDTTDPSATAMSAVVPQGSTSVHKALATPAVRRAAREHSIDITTIQGTGKDGRVLKEDVLRAAGVIAPAPASQPTTQNETKASPATPAAASPAAATPAASVSVPAGGYADETVPLRGFNRMMAKSMTEALSIPHFMLLDEVHADSMVEVRQQLKPMAEAQGIKFTYMPMMIKAASLAMLRYPYVNSSIAPDLSTITLHASHNIGFACATDSGLVVPNVKNCQDKSMFDIAAEVQRLIELARENKLPAEDLMGTTFTLSNIGTIGGIYGGPVINPPQVAIGAIGKLRKLPRFAEDGTVYPATIFNVSWAGDHRVLDGATMTKFSNAWIEYLQTPHLMMCDMR